MTVGELIETIIRLRGRQYGEDIMMGWLNEIEGQVIEEIVNRAEGYNVTFKPLSYDLDAETCISITCFLKLIITIRKQNGITMMWLCTTAHMMRMRHGSGVRTDQSAEHHFQDFRRFYGTIAIPDYGPKRKQPSDR